MDVRLVSYNVLSSSLCEAARYPQCEAGDLDPAVRLGRVQKVLEEHMSRSAILCLQEVSAVWAAKLTPFFESRGYTVVSVMYHPLVFTGYMGNLLCWPTGAFECLDADSVRTRDTQKPWPRRPPPPARSDKEATGFMDESLGTLEAALGAALNELHAAYRDSKPLVRDGKAVHADKDTVRWLGEHIVAKAPRPSFDPWEAASERENALVMARLRCKSSGGSFCVGSWHGPVAFGAPDKVQMATIQTALAAHALLDFANGAPCLLAGDFNQTPEMVIRGQRLPNGPYTLLTAGELTLDDPHRPPVREGAEWAAALPSPFASAYAVANGAEPELTTRAVMVEPRNPNPTPNAFVGTLDYIFTHGGSGEGTAEWAVRGVRSMPTAADAAAACPGGYPTADEPSDHLLIWADLSLKM